VTFKNEGLSWKSVESTRMLIKFSRWEMVLFNVSILWSIDYRKERYWKALILSSIWELFYWN
jgi:hypothetical protein